MNRAGKKRPSDSNPVRGNKKPKPSLLSFLPFEIIEHISDYLDDRNMVSFAATCKTVHGTLSRKLRFRYKTIVGCAIEGDVAGFSYFCDMYENPLRRKIRFLQTPEVKVTVPNKRTLKKVTIYWGLAYGRENNDSTLNVLFSECIQQASEHGHLNFIRYVMGKYSHLPDVTGRYLSMKGAMIQGHIHVVAFLLTESKTMRDFLVDGYSLEEVVYNGRLEMLRYVTENYSLSDASLTRAFRKACRTGHLDIVTFLSKHRRYDFLSGFIDACKYGHLNIVKYGLEHWPECTVLWNHYVNEGFNDACKKGKLKVVRYLLEYTASDGTSIITPDVRRVSFFLTLVNGTNCFPLLRYLFKKTSFDFTFENYQVAISETCRHRCAEIAKFLIENYQGSNRTEFHRSALIAAGICNWQWFVKFLLVKPGTDFDTETKLMVLRRASFDDFPDIVYIFCSLPDVKTDFEALLLNMVYYNRTLSARALLKLRRDGKIMINLLSIFVELTDVICESQFIVMGRLLFRNLMRDLERTPTADHVYVRQAIQIMFVKAVESNFLELVRFLTVQTARKTASGKEEYVINLESDRHHWLTKAVARKYLDIVEYVSDLTNFDGSIRVDVSFDNHALICGALMTGDIEMVRVLLQAPSTQARRHDFIVRFVTESVKMYKNVPVMEPCHMALFAFLFSYISPLRQILIFMNCKRNPPGIISEARKFLATFKKALELPTELLEERIQCHVDNREIVT